MRNTALSFASALLLLTSCNRPSDPPRPDAASPASSPHAAGAASADAAATAQPAGTAVAAATDGAGGAQGGAGPLAAADSTGTAAPGAGSASGSSTAAPGAADGSGSPATAAPGASGPIPLPITAAVAIAGEAPSPIAFDQQTVVDPTARFQVDVAVPLIDARLALIDGGDAMIPASESHEIGASWSRFTLVPEAPLRPGSTYSLRLDGAAEREAHDADGRSYQITVWTIRAAGEPPPPEKPATRPKRRR